MFKSSSKTNEQVIMVIEQKICSKVFYKIFLSLDYLTDSSSFYSLLISLFCWILQLYSWGWNWEPNSSERGLRRDGEKARKASIQVKSPMGGHYLGLVYTVESSLFVGDQCLWILWVTLCINILSVIFSMKIYKSIM